jgi:hypothetical protein
LAEGIIYIFLRSHGLFASIARCSSQLKSRKNIPQNGGKTNDPAG